MTDRQGILPVTVVNPLTQVVYPAGNTRFRSQQLNPFAARAEQSAADQRQRHRPLQQRRSAAADPRLQRQVRRQDRRSDQRQNDGVPALQPAQGHAILRARSNRALRRRRQRLHSRHRSERVDRLHLDGQRRRRCSKRASASRTCWPARSRRTWAGRAWPSLFAASRACRPRPNLTGGFNTQTISGFSTALGRQTTNPQFQNPDFVRSQAQLLETDRPAFAQDGLRADHLRTEVLDINPLYGQDTYNGQFSKPTCAQLGQAAGCTIAVRRDQLQPGRFHLRPAQRR